MKLPQLAHAAVGIASAALFLLISLLVSITDADTSPASPRLFGCANPYVETATTLARSGVVVFATLINDAPKWRALGLLACTLFMTWQFLSKVSTRIAHAFSRLVTGSNARSFCPVLCVAAWIHPMYTCAATMLFIQADLRRPLG
jgi:hypothetical protein